MRNAGRLASMCIPSPCIDSRSCQQDREPRAMLERAITKVLIPDVAGES